MKIPQFRKLVKDFEDAVRVHAQQGSGDPDEWQVNEFRYRQSKRALLKFGDLLITGENPDREMEQKKPRRKTIDENPNRDL